MNRLFIATALAVACARSLLTLASDKMEEIIVTSSRAPVPLRQLGTAVTVVSEQEIENTGLTSLAEVLGTQPAIGISSNGGRGKATAIRIRGEEGFRTLVLLDGMDISDTTGTQIGPNFAHLSSAGVSRVEVLRGPQGMMYGADAGGVVNITSYLPERDFGGRISVGGGRYGTRQLAANLGGKNGTGDFSLSASDYQTDGFNALATDRVLRDDDGYENTTLHGRLAWNATEQLRVQLTLRDIDADNDYDDCTDSDFNRLDNCNNTFAQTGVRLAATYSGDRFSQQLAVGRTDVDRAFFSADISSFVADGALEKYEYLGSLKLSHGHRLVYGADLKKESMADGGNTFERDQAGVYGEYQGELAPSLFVTIGARYDDNEDFGGFTSHRASAAYLMAAGSGTVKLKSSYGSGFRAPSLFEIGYNNGPFATSPATDATLKEEESRGFDIGVEYFGNSGVHLEAIYFDQLVRDEIGFDSFDFSGYVQGRGDAESKGVELIAEVPFDHTWTFSGHYTCNDTEAADGSVRVRRPRHLAKLGLLYARAGGRFSANLYVRGAYDSVDNRGLALDDYEVLNLSLRFSATDAVEFYGRVDNLLNEDYRESAAYNTSAVAGYAGLRYTF